MYLQYISSIREGQAKWEVIGGIKMYSNKDKLYLQTNDMPILKEKLEKAKQLSKELEVVLRDIDNYNLEFEIKKEET